MPMVLSINEVELDIGSTQELHDAMNETARDTYRDLCLRIEGEFPVLHALINGEVGWLMYLGHEGDAGFSSRNPSFSGDPTEVLGFELSNGQLDHYPVSWTLPMDVVVSALAHFFSTGGMAPFVHWNDDGG